MALKTIIMLLILILSCTPVHAQQHLEPGAAILTHDQDYVLHLQDLNKQLLPDVELFPLATMLCESSLWSPSWAVAICKLEKQLE